MTASAESRRRGRGAILLAVLELGCGAGSSKEETDPVGRGRALFESTGLSPSGLNRFSCSTCHDAHPAASGLLKSGAALAGATLRSSFWGGQEDDLLSAIEDCRRQFMLAGTPLRAGDADADALYTYLVSLEPGSSEGVPFSVERSIADVPRGDPERGRATFTSACAICHGSMHAGAGRLSERMPVLPDDTVLDHPAPSYTPRLLRLVFIEKTRHGGFLGYGGVMPPFSLEVLPDAALSDLLEALGVLGE
jgi:thiosulfate dehydrogenase